MARRGTDEEEARRYEDVIRSVASGVEGEKKQANALHVLQSKAAVEIYSLLRENGISDNAIKRIMKYSLDNIPRGKRLTPGAYARGMAEELAHSEEYEGVIDEMYREGIISERQYQGIKKEIGQYAEEHVRHLRKGLEKLVASVLGIAGFGLVIASGLRITGNVVGNAAANAPGAVIGTALLVISLTMLFKKFRR
jgi:hypothetical protein